MSRKIIKPVVLIVAVTSAFFSTLTSAAELIKNQATAQQVINDKPLSDALSKLTKRGYDYAIVQEGTAKRVIVSGYNGNEHITEQKANLVVHADNSVNIQSILINTPSKYQHYPAGSVIPVDLPINKIMSMKKGESVNVDLPSGQFTVEHDSITTDKSGNKTWIGHLSEEAPGYRMILSQGASGLIGHIVTPRGTFNIEDDESSSYLIDTQFFQSAGYDGDAVIPNETMMNAVIQNAAPPTSKVNAKKSVLLDTAATGVMNAAHDVAKLPSTENSIQKTAKTSETQTENLTVTPSTNTVVDLMVLYTTATTTSDFAKQRIQYLVDTSNQAYKDSGINMSLRLVYTEATDYSESVSNATALSDLSNDQGAFAGVKAKRVKYSADLVFLFRPLYSKTHGTCGTTYVGFSRGKPANSAIGFGTISDGIAKDSDTGYCQINTFTHEIGHSFGLVHDRDSSSFPGAFNYSYAWGVQGKFGTIMSYKSPMVMLFSSPNLTDQCAGAPCGFDETNTAKSSDQVKSVNFTAPKVADFMPTLTQ
jgi:hypothetical protein